MPNAGLSQKKTRCPGERPECSFCKRLGQVCFYRERETRTRLSHRKFSQGTSSEERVRTLESQVASLYKLLQSKPSGNDISNLLAGQSPMHDAPRLQQPAQGNRPLDSPVSDGDETSFDPPETISWSNESPILTSDIIKHFISIYRAKVYFQPLPLFCPQSLQNELDESSQYLLWGFVALCLHYTSHDYFTRPKEAIEYYRQISQNAVNQEVEKGVTSTQVLQTLCCLSICDILAKHPRAWINISSLTRLESFRRLSLQNSHKRVQDDERSLRCYWSAFILEKTFSPQYTMLNQTIRTPEYPPSAPQPVPIDCTRNYSQDLTFGDAASKKDAGINAYCLRALSQWGDVSQYLHRIRSGKKEDPWVPESAFHKIMADLFDFEARLDPKYFFRNVSFCDRSLAELERDREFWTPWVLMQFLSHASLAVLNHPLIHLMGFKTNIRPRLFLQRTVEQALYHTGWVVRLISSCQELGFVVYDPLIGQILVSMATIIWFFQFARDESVSKTALENMGVLEGHLNQLSMTWPHLLCALEQLRELQVIVENKKHDDPNDRAQVIFQPQKIWRILDPTIMCQIQSGLPMSVADQDDAQSSSDMIRVATTFVHPVVEDQVEPGQGFPLETPSYSYPQQHEPGELSLEEFLGDFFDPSPSWNLL
ncbi:unnamed protein product [Clonostachys rosea]|uniref:Transcription factor domain-containing protein n=1 Tax=Bionectria ochroleuca TaxID=29856 RepID=A0ABY6UI48_BIOOC|nr:unnamed protein product [Clonostachys rosea]